MTTRLAVFHATGYCDIKHEHEVTLITDGHIAYADTGLFDATGVTRDGVELTVYCGHPDRHDEPCHGQVTFRLDTDGWTADPTHLKTLDLYGEKVDQ